GAAGRGGGGTGARYVSCARRHDVSILTTGAVELGRCLGSQPGAKISMMSIRPPQQGQGRGSTQGCSVSAAFVVLGSLESGGAASNSRALAILAARLA